MAKWIFGLGLAFAVGALAMAFVVVARQPKLPPPLTLPSGETLILRGVTYGTNHLAPRGPRWLRLLSERVPAFLRQRLTARFIRGTPLFADRTTTEPHLLLWLEVESGAATNRSWSTNVWLMLQDERGRVAGERQDVALHFWPKNPRVGKVVEFRAFPRRGTQIGVVLIQGSYDQPVVVGYWQIPNPVRSAARSWETESLPQTRTNGNLECTLGALAAGTGTSSGIGSERGGGMRFQINAATPGTVPGAAFPAIFRERGIETNTWTIGSVTLADATGNVLSSSGTSWSSISNTVFFHWNPVLWPGEGWELRLIAKRTKEAQFTPGEIVEFRDIIVPGLDTPVSPIDEIKVNGVTLQTKQFVLRQRSDPNSWSGYKISHLKLMVTGLTNGLYLDAIKATDDEGRTYRCGSWGGQLWIGRRLGVFVLVS